MFLIGGHPTMRFDPNVGSSPQTLDLPIHKIGEERGGKRSWEGKNENSTPTIL